MIGVLLLVPLAASAEAWGRAYQRCLQQQQRVFLCQPLRIRNIHSSSILDAYHSKSMCSSSASGRPRVTSCHMMGISPDSSYPTKTQITSLASSYVIHASNPVPNEFVWTLSTIDSVTSPTSEEGVGTVAIRALRSPLPVNLSVANALCCKVDVKDSNLPRLKVSVEKEDTDDDHVLLDVMARVLLQWAGTSLGIKSSTKANISLPGGEFALSTNDLLTVNPSVLFGKYLGNEPTEMSEMVDCNGEKLGVVPRSLVHKLNLLHRGIGVVVSRDERISRDMENPPEVYVHQRTDTKSIFPSLYDMFCGGISTAGEDAKLTAAREVAEELGLSRAVEDIDSDALLGPLFKCTIYTGYSRCVVSIFTNKCNSSDERIRWQEEEVQWVEFVPYNVVECAGSRSINRLKDLGEWPGSVVNCDGDFFCKSDDDCRGISFGDGSWMEWDFVPDGLLVWEAWVRWRRGEEIM